MVKRYDLFKYGFRSYYLSHKWPGDVVRSLLDSVRLKMNRHLTKRRSLMKTTLELETEEQSQITEETSLDQCAIRNSPILDKCIDLIRLLLAICSITILLAQTCMDVLSMVPPAYMVSGLGLAASSKR